MGLKSAKQHYEPLSVNRQKIEQFSTLQSFFHRKEKAALQQDLIDADNDCKKVIRTKFKEWNVANICWTDFNPLSVNSPINIDLLLPWCFFLPPAHRGGILFKASIKSVSRGFLSPVLFSAALFRYSVESLRLNYAAKAAVQALYHSRCYCISR